MAEDERDRALVLDILAAGAEIRAYLGRWSAEVFGADGKTCRAVERCLEIIGEAARSLSEPFRQAHSQVPWRKIIGLRNRISHEYGDVDYEEIFLIATVSVPELTDVLEPLRDLWQAPRKDGQDREP